MLAKQKKKANISFILVSRSNKRIKTFRECHIAGVGIQLLLFFLNEDEVCVTLGDALCLNQSTQMWDDMFGFSQQLNRSFLRGDGLQAFPLSSAL